MKNVYLIGAYCTQFKKWLDKSNKELARDAFVGVLEGRPAWKTARPLKMPIFQIAGWVFSGIRILFGATAPSRPMVEEGLFPEKSSHHQCRGGMRQRFHGTSRRMEGYSKRNS